MGAGSLREEQQITPAGTRTKWARWSMETTDATVQKVLKFVGIVAVSNVA